MITAFASGGCFHSRTAMGMFEHVRIAAPSAALSLTTRAAAAATLASAVLVLCLGSTYLGCLSTMPWLYIPRLH